MRTIWDYVAYIIPVVVICVPLYLLVNHVRAKTYTPTHEELEAEDVRYGMDSLKSYIERGYPELTPEQWLWLKEHLKETSGPLYDAMQQHTMNLG